MLLSSSRVPHKKMVFGNDVYYAAQYLEGDYSVWLARPSNQEGCGGREICFLLENGEAEYVRGPWHVSGTMLTKKTGDESFSATATKVEVWDGMGYKCGWPAPLSKVLFSEEEWSLSNPYGRIDPIYLRAGSIVVIKRRDGASMCSARSDKRFETCIDYLHMWS